MVIEQRQTILNMYNSGILPEVIALQMDKTKEEILQIIEKSKAEEEKNKKNRVELSFPSEVKVRKNSSIPLITKAYFDKAVNIDHAIKNAQSRMWKALTVKSDFNISMEETQNVLNNYAESKATFVILHIDLVDSTKLSMTLPVNRLVAIIQAFLQEMSVILSAYGGYVLKYIGDAVLAFFIVDSSPNNLYLRCINAMECACSMIKVVSQGINPILNQYDYPELRVRIGIDVGENAVVQFGWDTHTLDGKVITKSPHFDILGYTISIAAKMTVFAKPDQIIIGQLVYDVLEEDKQSTFRLLSMNPQMWDYFSNRTGGIYHLYSSINESESEYKDENTDGNLRHR